MCSDDHNVENVNGTRNSFAASMRPPASPEQTSHRGLNAGEISEAEREQMILMALQLGFAS